MGPKDRTRAVRLGCKCIYLLFRLASPPGCLWNLLGYSKWVTSDRASTCLSETLILSVCASWQLPRGRLRTIENPVLSLYNSESFPKALWGSWHVHLHAVSVRSVSHCPLTRQQPQFKGAAYEWEQADSLTKPASLPLPAHYWLGSSHEPSHRAVMNLMDFIRPPASREQGLDLQSQMIWNRLWTSLKTLFSSVSSWGCCENKWTI